ncbi:RHS repeat domain-containing protein [Aquimarina longa]|uniref:RHS repeat domain-containing protein n=1 Tax=Aquimarina longa TaxID=1080221 RepID=UPI000784C230|nr:RHS repeat-associated core domain-containing protein [Aquimarina longa]
MGNIESLTRNGWQNSSNYTNLDVLGYDYDSGNKLLKVTDTGNKTYGFKESRNAIDDFEYDSNGNMTIDRNKGITGITYNHLNLPETVTINNSKHTGTISYIYDATGAKLKKIATEGSSLTETAYAGNYVYKNGVLEFFNHPEGYVEKEADGYKYVYQFKDHLGNIRLLYSDTDNNGSISTSEIKEEKNYYPFGSIQKGYNNIVRGRKHNYGYNGKEEQNDLDFNTLDFGARFYDPALGRWFTPDALAEKYYSTSPFTYALNNPILYIDPDGNQVAMCCEELQGFVAGMVDNTIGTNFRSRGNTQAFRNGVSIANGTSAAISTILLVDGATNAAAGTAGLVASGAATLATAGGGSIATGPTAAASGALLAKGAAEIGVSAIITNNVKNNMKADAQNGNNNSSSKSKTSESGQYTEPTLPEKTIVDEKGVKVEHYYKSGDHAPAHMHVKGKGANTKIGANGKPIKGSAELTSSQSKVIEANKSKIRSAGQKINKYQKYQNYRKNQ